VSADRGNQLVKPDLDPGDRQLRTMCRGRYPKVGQRKDAIVPFSRFHGWLRKERGLWYLLGTWFGCGYATVGPGTVATITVLPFYWWLRLSSMPLQMMVVAVVLALSIASAGWIAADLKQDDPQIIVIDEVSGALVGLLLVDSSRPGEQIAVLLLFRLLDIFKPWPINIAVGGPPAIGIVYDDVVAGIGAGLLVLLGAALFQQALPG
jgi:phosphatidylglycerophosphatase A